MEGLGNDFIVVDLRAAPAPAWLDDGALIARLCDRHRGVGADGVLAILPPSPGVAAAARMRVRNADGSEAEMCGNGLRCVALYLLDEQPGTAEILAELMIETGAGVRRCGRPDAAVATPQQAGREAIEVSMGPPRLRRAEVPMLGPADEPCIDQQLRVGGEELRVTAVSMGNPHAVLFAPPGVSGAALRALAERLGPSLEAHPSFPRRTNVELCQRHGSDDYEVVVWERGCGITQACGTGACAVAVAATQLGYAAVDRWLRVRLLGGTLHIRVLAAGADVHMRGPARYVFRGQLEPLPGCPT
jgi:diaminopimelate epimerase